MLLNCEITSLQIRAGLAAPGIARNNRMLSRGVPSGVTSGKFTWINKAEK